MKKLFLILFFLNGCAISLKEQSKLYFRNPKKYYGVEAPLELKKRLEKHKTSLEILYGQNKTSQILSCTFLRNQLYVAMLSNNLDSKIKNAALLLEEAYQNDDNEFIKSCENIFKEDFGKIFLSTQKEFLRITS